MNKNDHQLDKRYKQNVQNSFKIAIFKQLYKHILAYLETHKIEKVILIDFHYHKFDKKCGIYYDGFVCRTIC